LLHERFKTEVLLFGDRSYNVDSSSFGDHIELPSLLTGWKRGIKRYRNGLHNLILNIQLSNAFKKLLLSKGVNAKVTSFRCTEESK
jgi:hypothetical protein